MNDVHRNTFVCESLDCRPSSYCVLVKCARRADLKSRYVPNASGRTSPGDDTNLPIHSTSNNGTRANTHAGICSEEDDSNSIQSEPFYKTFARGSEGEKEQ